MGKNWNYAARIVWDILVRQARQRATITYGEIAPVIKTNPRSVGRALGPIQDFCMVSGLPPLTSLVVDTSGVPGGGFIAWEIDDLETAQRLVFDFDWTEIPNPYGQFGENDTISSFAKILVKNPDAAPEVFVKVRARGVGQLVFRRALLDAYGWRCAFCELTFDEALDGAHIVGWNECTPAQRIDPRNGLLLCAGHHRLFDHASITVSRSFKIVYYDVSMQEGSYSKTDKSFSVRLHGKRICLPKSRKLWPSPKYLAIRHGRQKWGDLP
ncbi:MAG TPA: HNH endonuclease [Xanthobacteraceae bacterium]|jgi:putative restriction endonuclease|nr:HNH endonuclease [Xanthobacteraceae bacterium]